MSQKIILNTTSQGDIHLEMQGHTLTLITSQFKKELSHECYPSFDAAVGPNDTVYIVYSTPSTTYLTRFFNNTFDMIPLQSICGARNFHLMLHGNVPVLFYTTTQNMRTLLYLSFLTSDGRPFFIDACSNLDQPFAICTDPENKDILITYVSPYGSILTRRLVWSSKALSELVTLDQKSIGTKYPSCLFDGGLHVSYLVKDKNSSSLAYCPPDGKPFFIYQYCGNQTRPILWKDTGGLKVSFLQENIIFHIALNNLSVEKQEVPPQTQLAWIKRPASGLRDRSESQMTFLYEQSGEQTAAPQQRTASQRTATPSSVAGRRKAPVNLSDEILEFSGAQVNKPENLELEKLKIRIKFLEDKLAEIERRSQSGQTEEA